MPAKKYDTNPLDPEVLQRAETARRAAAFNNNGAPYSVAADFKSGEMPTMRYPNGVNNLADYDQPYNSVYAVPQTAADTVQTTIDPPTSRPIPGLNLPENLVLAAPYLPFSIGIIPAVIWLLFVPNTETRVRFHAAQALALQLIFLLAKTVLGIAAGAVGLPNITGRVLTAVVTILLVVSIVRVLRGKPHHIEALDELTDWLNEKIRPKKKW